MKRILYLQSWGGGLALIAGALLSLTARGPAQTCPPWPPVYVCGTNLIWNYTGGPSNLPIYVVASTNLMLVSAQWTCVSSNWLDNWGRCQLVLPIEPDKPRRFYRLAAFRQ